MSAVSVKVTGPTEADNNGVNWIKKNVFVILSLGSPNLGRAPHNDYLSVDTEVIVDSSFIRAVWDSGTNAWKAIIPQGTVLAVYIGSSLKIAETAQPIQVSGPVVPFLDLGS